MAIKQKIKAVIKQVLLSIGKKTNKHIIVFESDDWGAVRIPSKTALTKFKEKFPNEKLDQYQSYDCLECDNDIDNLKNVLGKHIDCKKSQAVFTLNFATANPDFDKIRENNYQKFEYQTINDTYSKSENSKNIISKVKNGQKSGCFEVQLHAREHVNSKYLLEDITNCDEKVKYAFSLNMVGVGGGEYCSLDSFSGYNKEENYKALKEAQEIFEHTFGYKSETIIAPCYVWSVEDEQSFVDVGIKSLQGKSFQNVPIERDKYKHKFHSFGSMNKKNNLFYFSRNVNFEPAKGYISGENDDDIINNTLKEIENAFKCKKPAVICSHRVNYVGGIDDAMSKKSLVLLDRLLSEVESKYSDILYMSTTKMHKEMVKSL